MSDREMLWFLWFTFSCALYVPFELIRMDWKYRDIVCKERKQRKRSDTTGGG